MKASVFAMLLSGAAAGSCGGVAQQSVIMQAVDAAFLRNRISGLVREDKNDRAELNSPSLAREGELIDVWTFYLSEDGVEEEYPFPDRASIASNTRLSTVLETGVVYICDFLPDYLAFPQFPLPAAATYANDVMADIWATIDAHYGTTTQIEWVYSNPTEGSHAHFTNLRNGRYHVDGGCDVDAAPAAFGGYFEHKPRTTGPNGQFTVSVPIQAAQFSLVVRDDSTYYTFDDVLANANSGELTICYANRNAGISETFFRNSIRVPEFYNIREACKESVLADSSGNTMFLSEFETTDTTEKEDGLKTISMSTVVPIGYYSTNDPGADYGCVLCNADGEVIDEEAAESHGRRNLLFGAAPVCCEATYV